MFSSSRSVQNRVAQRCAICEGKFGLVRHYSWRTAVCSRNCAHRLKARRADDRRWLLGSSAELPQQTADPTFRSILRYIQLQPMS
jgi:hypothetical protein